MAQRGNAFSFSGVFFSCLEIVLGSIILRRWRLSEVVGSFSRIAALLYSWSYIGALLLMPFGEEFRHNSARTITGIYLFYYLFCILVLSNKSARAFFPSTKPAVMTATPQIFEEVEFLRMKKRLKLLGTIILADGLCHGFLFLFVGGDAAPGFIHSGFILPEIAIGLMLLGGYSWTRAWVITFSFLAVGSYFVVPWIMILNAPNLAQESPKIAHYLETHRFFLIAFNFFYAVFFSYVLVFLFRRSAVAFFAQKKLIEKGKDY